jgi:hypothetical protein
MLCGGIGNPQTSNELTPEAAACDAFVKEKVPELANSHLHSWNVQVVAGSLYRFTYHGYEGEIKVWDKPWENFRQITLPNGNTIQ